MSRPSLVLVTDNPNSWAVQSNLALVADLRALGCTVELVHDIAEAPPADIAIYLNCLRIVPAEQRARFGLNLVVHASDLPKGRGWSPLTWQILEGKDRVVVTLFEAVEELDAGQIYLQHELSFEGHELVDELREQLDAATRALVLRFVQSWPDVTPREQRGEPSFYPRRRPADSRLDIDRPLRESFALLRVVDNDRYPAFFEHAGHIYELRITKRGPAR